MKLFLRPAVQLYAVAELLLRPDAQIPTAAEKCQHRDETGDEAAAKESAIVAIAIVTRSWDDKKSARRDKAAKDRQSSQPDGSSLRALHAKNIALVKLDSINYTPFFIGSQMNLWICSERRASRPSASIHSTNLRGSSAILSAVR